MDHKDWHDLIQYYFKLKKEVEKIEQKNRRKKYEQMYGNYSED